jgi:transcriptional regulator with XRE-family HTH domain
MLGERLIKLRKSRKLTQQQIADKLHLSRGTYAQYEIDRRVPEYVTLEKLADFFEVSLDYLVGRDIKEGKSQLSEIDRKILEGVKSLPEEKKEEVMNFIDFSLKKHERK